MSCYPAKPTIQLAPQGTHAMVTQFGEGEEESGPNNPSKSEN